MNQKEGTWKCTRHDERVDEFQIGKTQKQAFQKGECRGYRVGARARTVERDSSQCRIEYVEFFLHGIIDVGDLKEKLARDSL